MNAPRAWILSATLVYGSACTEVVQPGVEMVVSPQIHIMRRLLGVRLRHLRFRLPPPVRVHSSWVAVAMESSSAAATLGASNSGGTGSRGTSFPVRPGALTSTLTVDGTTSPVLDIVWLDTDCVDSDMECQAKETCQQVTDYTCLYHTYSCWSVGPGALRRV